MGRFALAAVFGMLWLSATRADACPAGSPCLKYRNIQQTVNVTPEYFSRSDGAAIPKWDRKKLTRYLTSALWSPFYGEAYGIYAKNPYYRVNYIKSPLKLRFIDATTKIPAPAKNEQVVIVRGIERNSDGDVFVDVDGIAYQLWYCVSKKAAEPCLTTTGTDFYSMFPTTADAAPSQTRSRVFDDDLVDAPTLKKLPF